MKRYKLLVAIALVMGCVLCLSTNLWAEDTGQVDINTASAGELATLKKVGPKTAARIVEYRNSVGAFKSPEELMSVKGIGRKIFELNKDRIIVGGAGNAAPAGDNNVSLQEVPSGKKG